MIYIITSGLREVESEVVSWILVVVRARSRSRNQETAARDPHRRPYVEMIGGSFCRILAHRARIQPYLRTGHCTLHPGHRAYTRDSRFDLFYSWTGQNTVNFTSPYKEFRYAMWNGTWESKMTISRELIVMMHCEMWLGNQESTWQLWFLFLTLKLQYFNVVFTVLQLFTVPGVCDSAALYSIESSSETVE